MTYCTKCGAVIDDNAKFCNICGNPVSSEAQPQPFQQNQQYQQYGGQYYGYANDPKPDMGYPIVAPVVNHPTISEVFSKAFAFLGQKPVQLWGITLLYMLLGILVTFLGVLPIITIPINLVLCVGMTFVFLESYRGKEVKPEQLFIGFKNFFHFCGGMAWMMLWIFIWGLIPIAGIVFAVMKAYSYRFVPYILLTQPEISASDALNESMKQTEGYRGRMFVADLIMTACITGVLLVFMLLGYIPYMGIIFNLIYSLLAIAVSIFAPIVYGVVQAAFYDEISKKTADSGDQAE